MTFFVWKGNKACSVAFLIGPTHQVVSYIIILQYLSTICISIHLCGARMRFLFPFLTREIKRKRKPIKNGFLINRQNIITTSPTAETPIIYIVASHIIIYTLIFELMSSDSSPLLFLQILYTLCVQYHSSKCISTILFFFLFLQLDGRRISIPVGSSIKSFWIHLFLIPADISSIYLSMVVVVVVAGNNNSTTKKYVNIHSLTDCCCCWTRDGRDGNKF